MWVWSVNPLAKSRSEIFKLLDIRFDDMKYRIKNRSSVCVYNFVSFSFNPSGSPLTEQTVLYFEEQSCNKQINPSETL